MRKEQTLWLGICMMRYAAFALYLLAGVPAAAQLRDGPVAVMPLQDQPVALQPEQSPTWIETGRVAESSVGQVGQRQTRDETATGIRPTARIASRIQNRVQSRIRNRIDRSYDPRSDATSPFAAAEEQTRASGRPHS